MKTPHCYSNMKLRLDRRKTVWLFISVKLKHAKERTYTLLHLCTCCLCTEKCHLTENANQNVTNIKSCDWDSIFLCLHYSQAHKGEHSIEIYFRHKDVMLKSVLMLLVNPLIFEECMFTVTLNKAKYIEGNKDAI